MYLPPNDCPKVYDVIHNSMRKYTSDAFGESPLGFWIKSNFQTVGMYTRVAETILATPQMSDSQKSYPAKASFYEDL